MRKSLSAKLSFWIVLATALLFIGVLAYLAWLYRNGIRREVEKDAVQLLDNTVMRVGGILEDAQLAADNLCWVVEHNLDRADEMVTYANETVRHNPVLNSCSISFEPYYYPEKGEFYSVFSYRTSNGISWEQEGDEDYRYFEKAWYLLPRELGPCWTDPYSDFSEKDDPEMDTKKLVSCCQPVYDRDSAFVGAVSVDISLKWLSNTLHEVKPYPNAYCIMVDLNGEYLVHPDPEKVFYQSLFTKEDAATDPERFELGLAMTRMEEGMRFITIDGERNYVFFKPLETTGWSVAIFCPESDIIGGFNRLRRNLVLNLIGALLVMFFLFVWLIRRQLAPLHKLAEEADFIASGNFENPMPAENRSDEIGQLSHSFRHMQSSLVQHIRELTESTATRERMARELQIARNIQMGMVPHEFNLEEDIDLYALIRPAREVGGDLYDFFVQGRKLYLCIGDVSGKGIPASLLMAVARAMFRVVARQELPPEEIARRINDTVAEKNEQMIFVTMFIATIDLTTGAMDYCNCGHNPPVLLSGCEPAFLDCTANTAIGIMPDFDFEGQRLDDIRDKVLFLYTDGLNEAENAAHEQFGNERMLAVLGREPFQDTRSLVERINLAVATHVDGAEANDDMTLLCLKIKNLNDENNQPGSN